MSECKQTNPYATEDHHTHVLSDPHNTTCSAGAAEEHTSSDLISFHSAKPTCNLTTATARSGFPVLDFAKVVDRVLPEPQQGGC